MRKQMDSDEFEIEVAVRPISQEPDLLVGPRMLVKSAERLVLAGIGALASVRDEIEQALDGLVKQGELVRRDGQFVVEQLVETQRQGIALRRSQLAQQVEARLDQVLSRLNVPSKRDVDELQARIAQLTARLDELSGQAGARPDLDAAR
jgi:poly(hydroxyalkanoate) granule-associated protein